MFAVKQCVKSITPRLRSTISPNFHSKCAPSFRKVLPQQSVVFSPPHSCFSCSNNWAATVKNINVEQTSTTETCHTEPDVLYHMVEIEIKCSDPVVLQSYNKSIALAAEFLGLNIAHNEVSKKPHIKRWTVLKSRFVHKKHMVTYEVRTYHHKIQLERLTGSTADTFLEYIQRNLPEGVSMRVGRVRMEKLPEHLLTPPSLDN